MKKILGKPLERYFLEHVRELTLEDRRFRTHWTMEGKLDFYEVTKPLHVFKKAWAWSKFEGTEAIVNLVIPEKALIYTSWRAFKNREDDDSSWTPSIDARKMRASVVEVHSIATIKTEQQLTVASSNYTTECLYKSGKVVYSKNMNGQRHFSLVQEQCAAGIHFFLNLEDAIEYDF